MCLLRPVFPLFFHVFHCFSMGNSGFVQGVFQAFPAGNPFQNFCVQPRGGQVLHLGARPRGGCFAPDGPVRAKKKAELIGSTGRGRKPRLFRFRSRERFSKTSDYPVILDLFVSIRESPFKERSALLGAYRDPGAGSESNAERGGVCLSRCSAGHKRMEFCRGGSPPPPRDRNRGPTETMDRARRREGQPAAGE